MYFPICIRCSSTHRRYRENTISNRMRNILGFCISNIVYPFIILVMTASHPSWDDDSEDVNVKYTYDAQKRKNKLFLMLKVQVVVERNL